MAPTADAAQHLGMSAHSLYAWIKIYSKPQSSVSKTMTSKPNCASSAQNSSV